MSNKAKKVVGTSAAVIACCVPFLQGWEGMDLVAKRDPIGTGNPITYCNGLTSHDHSVEVGQRFTPAQCRAELAEYLPKYWDNITPCIKADLPVQTAAALLDAAWNAGEDAVCRSPMLAKMNAGDIKGGCEAFEGWYITTKVHGIRRPVRGLIARRAGDYRKGEKQLCLEGLTAPKPVPAPVKLTWWAWLKSIFSH